MKCLEKDRTRRYETASGLAMDIGRYLGNEPITARPPSATYRLRKMVRRNKLAFGAAAVVLLALLLGISVSTWQAVRATRAKQEALAAQAQAVAAEANEANQRQLADAARANEADLRQQAQVQELAARRRAYAADMLLCQQALAANNLRRARLLLERQRPAAGDQDLRGWEWRYLWQQCQGEAQFKLDMRGKYGLSAVFTKDGNSVVTFAGKGRVSLWNLATRQEEVVLQDEWSTEPMISNSGQFSASADGTWIAAAGRGTSGQSVVRIWDVNRGTMVCELTIGTTPINALALSPDKQWLAVYLRLNQTVSVWNVGKKQREIQFPASDTKAYSPNPSGAVAFSPDGAILAIGDFDGRIRLVDAHHWAVKTILPGIPFGRSLSAGGISTLVYSPDGRFLACGSAFLDPRILVWDTATNKKIATLEGHLGFISDLTFSPDGKILASSSGDQTIKLWNTDTWKERDTLLGHNDEVWSVAFSSDGERLVSCGKDGAVCVWSVSGQRQDRESFILPNGIQDPDISPDGKSVVGISDGGRAHLLQTSTLWEKTVPQELEQRASLCSGIAAMAEESLAIAGCHQAQRLIQRIA